MRIEFRRPAGDVERRDAPMCQHRNDEIYSLALHLLGALRARAHMAMHARLIAAIADIDLQGVEPPSDERWEFDLFEQWPSIAHRVSEKMILLTVGAERCASGSEIRTDACR